MQLSTRPVSPADIGCISGFPLNREELFFFAPRAEHPLDPGQLRRAMRGRLEPTVVVDRDRVVAFANLYGFRFVRHCFIGNVIVHPEWRGRGVGRYLVEHMANRAASAHRITQVRVSCFEPNTVAMALYTALGFAPYACEQRRDWRGREVVLQHLRRGEA
jgi:ribosomal protein S18 acetylase RimI-like enzyme